MGLNKEIEKVKKEDREKTLGHLMMLREKMDDWDAKDYWVRKAKIEINYLVKIFLA